MLERWGLLKLVNVFLFIMLLKAPFLLAVLGLDGTITISLSLTIWTKNAPSFFLFLNILFSASYLSCTLSSRLTMQISTSHPHAAIPIKMLISLFSFWNVLPKVVWLTNPNLRNCKLTTDKRMVIAFIAAKHSICKNIS